MVVTVSNNQLLATDKQVNHELQGASPPTRVKITTNTLYA